MSTVRALLGKKGQQEIYSVLKSTTVLGAVDVMRQKDVGALLVMEKGELVGIFTERDYCRKGEVLGRRGIDTPVADVMTPAENVHSVTSCTTLEECLAIMDSKHIRHLPVIEDNKVSGIISIRDVLRGIMEHQIWMADMFQGYISGRS